MYARDRHSPEILALTHKSHLYMHVNNTFLKNASKLYSLLLIILGELQETPKFTVVSYITGCIYNIGITVDQDIFKNTISLKPSNGTELTSSTYSSSFNTGVRVSKSVSPPSLFPPGK